MWVSDTEKMCVAVQVTPMFTTESNSFLWAKCRGLKQPDPKRPTVLEPMTNLWKSQQFIPLKNKARSVEFPEPIYSMGNLWAPHRSVWKNKDDLERKRCESAAILYSVQISLLESLKFDRLALLPRMLGDYFYQKGTKWQDAGLNWIMTSCIPSTLHEILLR